MPCEVEAKILETDKVSGEDLVSGLPSISKPAPAPTCCLSVAGLSIFKERN